MKIGEEGDAKSVEETSMGCICGIVASNSTFLLDMDVAIGKRLAGNYYEVYFNTNVELYYPEAKKKVFSSCSTINCSKYKELSTPV